MTLPFNCQRENRNIQVNSGSSAAPQSGIWKDRQGQDLIELALLAGFVAVTAAALVPGLASDIGVILSKIPGLVSGSGNGSLI